MRKTPLTAVRARRRLTLNVRAWNPNDSGRIVLEKGTNLTRDEGLLDLLKADYGDVVEIDERRQFFDRAAPVSSWPQLKSFKGRVLVVMPSNAIGDCAMVLCALAAVKDAAPDLELGVAFVGRSHPVFPWDPDIRVHPYVLHENELKQYQGLVDLYNFKAWGGQAYTPFDFEGELLKAFAVPPSPRIAGKGRPPRDPNNPVIRVFPLASSPVRNLPPAATAALARAAADVGQVEIVLSPYQPETDRYIAALKDELPAGVGITTDIRRTRDLIKKVAETDYGIFTDSGPCHIAKLYDVMGFAVFTTIPAELRVGRYHNIRVWQARYSGRHCTAPCGLSMLLRTPSGKRGCWETLGPEHGGYRVSKVVGDRDECFGFTFVNPVPCVATLRDGAPDLAQALAEDIDTRLVRGLAEPADAGTSR